MQRHKIIIKDRFCFEAGGHLDELELVYHTSPRPYRPGDKVVWICHAFTGNSDPEDWWAQLVGKGQLIDPEKYFVVCHNILCSPYGSSCPVSINQATGQPFSFDFPDTTIRDIVNAGILVRKHLGIEKIDLMLGPSVGGFQVFEWCLAEPDVISNAVFLATDARVTPYLNAFNECQLMALEADASFREAASASGGEAGLRCARTIGVISYRSFDAFCITQKEADSDRLFSDHAAANQRHQGEKFIRRNFDAYSYWYLIRSINSHNLGRGRGGVQAALGQIKSRCLMVNMSNDGYFPPKSGAEIVSAIPDARQVVVETVYGHDGFLIENDKLVAVLKPFLSENGLL